MADGTLRLDLVNVYGNFLDEPVDIILRNQTMGTPLRLRGKQVTSAIELTKLQTTGSNVYDLRMFPLSYQPVGRVVMMSPGAPRELLITFPIDPRKVVEVRFPAFSGILADAQALLVRSSAVLGHVDTTGEKLYGALVDESRAGLLNIVAKCNRTRLSMGRTVLSFLQELIEIRGDRFFAKAPKELREETKSSALAGIFESAPTLLHRPPDGFSTAGSWKTKDDYGNLQLTFFSNGTDWLADIDIDNAAGFQHLFQVIENVFTGGTHPYTIHNILIHRQELDPGYSFVLERGDAAGV